jgi:TLC domain
VQLLTALKLRSVFHPKQKAWNEYLASSKILQVINEISRVSFAVLYVLCRVIYFPYVVLSGVLPESLNSANIHPELTGPLYAIMILAVLFTLLQLYWGTLVIRQIVKALLGNESKRKEE